MATLIVFYSLTGTARSVAGALARELGADIEEIRCARYRRGFWGFLKAVMDSRKGKLPPIETPLHDPSRYGRVIVGGPIWAWLPAPPVRSYLKDHAQHLSGLSFFLTHGGSPPEGALRMMEDLAGRPPEATLVVREAEVKSGNYLSKVAAFASSLKKSSAA